MQSLQKKISMVGKTSKLHVFMFCPPLERALDILRMQLEIINIFLAISSLVCSLGLGVC
jgi:hypothetical protein